MLKYQPYLFNMAIPEAMTTKQASWRDTFVCFFFKFIIIIVLLSNLEILVFFYCSFKKDIKPIQIL